MSSKERARLIREAVMGLETEAILSLLRAAGYSGHALEPFAPEMANRVRAALLAALLGEEAKP
jgi:hypothetical protein